MFRLFHNSFLCSHLLRECSCLLVVVTCFASCGIVTHFSCDQKQKTNKIQTKYKTIASIRLCGPDVTNSAFQSFSSLGRRYGGASTSLGTGASDLSRSRSSHALKARESSPLRSSMATAAGEDKDGAALSSWARYLKNKYGNRTSKDAPRDTAAATTTTPAPSSSSSTSSSAARRLSLGLPLRQANEVGSSDDDSKNALGSPTTTT